MISLILSILGGIFAVVGMSIAMIALWINKINRKIIEDCTACTVGRFDRFTRRLGVRRGDRMRCYYPVYIYTVNGQSYDCSGHLGSPNTENVREKNKMIFYNPDNPAESYTDRKVMDMVFRILLLVGLGMTALGVAGICMKYMLFP